MDGVVYAGGGFNGAGLDDVSPGLRARIAAADARDRQEAIQAEREWKRQAEIRQESDIAASVRMAEERGELITRQMRQHGAGRTRAEAISYYSAVQDLEDARVAARRRKELENFELFRSERESVDVTAQTDEGLRMKVRAWRRRAS